MGRDMAGTGELEMVFDSFFYKDSHKILADKKDRKIFKRFINWMTQRVLIYRSNLVGSFPSCECHKTVLTPYVYQFISNT